MFMMWKVLALAVLLCVFHHVFGETGCPELESMSPCYCYQVPYTYLHCRNIRNDEELREVFVKSERYTYDLVHIEHSIMQYIPYDIFERVKVKVLFLDNVTLYNLFDRPPKALDELSRLSIRAGRVERGILWQVLEPLKSLRILDINYNSIKTLGEDFSNYVTKELEELIFYGTETRSIKPGTLTNFTKLDKIAIQSGKLTTLTRDIFPTPFNGRLLWFSGNNIKTIPEGLFTQMPNLQEINMGENQIATLPEKAFDSKDSVSRIKSLTLEDNPLKCDCCLVWLMDHKPQKLEGKCISPKKLAGSRLKHLDRTDFNCEADPQC